MPAQRSQKKTRGCAGYSKEAATTAAAGASTTKAFLPWEEVDKEAEKALRKIALEEKKEWEAKLVPWVVNPQFKFPIGTQVMYKSDAKTAYGLNDKEMMTLQHESVPRSTKTFFSLEDVQELAFSKFDAGVFENCPVYDNPKINLMFIGGGFTLFEKVDNNSRSHKKNFKDITHRHDLDYIRVLSGKAEKS